MKPAAPIPIAETYAPTSFALPSSSSATPMMLLVPECFSVACSTRSNTSPSRDTIPPLAPVPPMSIPIAAVVTRSPDVDPANVIGRALFDPGACIADVPAGFLEEQAGREHQLPRGCSQMVE